MKKLFIISTIIYLFSFQDVLASVQDDINALDNNTTTLSNTANNMNTIRLNKAYPIGSIYLSTTFTSVSAVANVLGGTWEIYAPGRTIVGAGTGTDINGASQSFTVNNTGGEYSHVVTTSELPSHTHGVPALNATAASSSSGAHTQTIPALTGTAATKSLTGTFGTGGGSAVLYPSETGGVFSNAASNPMGMNNWDGVGGSSRPGIVHMNSSHSHTFTTSSTTSGSSGAHTHSITVANTTESVGSTTAHNNIQPYSVLYMYKRVS